MIEGVDPHPSGAIDLGADRDEHERQRLEVCANRLPSGGLCTRFSGHGEDCGSALAHREIPTPDFGPEASKRRRY